MKSVEQLIKEVQKEQNRTDKQLESIQFEIRQNEVTMFFLYRELFVDSEQHHYIRHNHDPEFLDKETFENLKEQLMEMDIPFTERSDIFM